jgi:hypothetical protein
VVGYRPCHHGWVGVCASRRPSAAAGGCEKGGGRGPVRIGACLRAAMSGPEEVIVHEVRLRTRREINTKQADRTGAIQRVTKNSGRGRCWTGPGRWWAFTTRCARLGTLMQQREGRDGRVVSIGVRSDIRDGLPSERKKSAPHYVSLGAGGRSGGMRHRAAAREKQAAGRTCSDHRDGGWEGCIHGERRR